MTGKVDLLGEHSPVGAFHSLSSLLGVGTKGNEEINVGAGVV